jgi:hypothetical protein
MIEDSRGLFGNRTMAGDARVVDHDVKSPLSSAHRGNGISPIGLVAHIDPQGACPIAGRANIGRDGLCRLEIEVHQIYVRAFASEKLGYSAANPRTGRRT